MSFLKPSKEGFLFYASINSLMSKYVNRFGNLIFSVAEQEIIQNLQDHFCRTFTEAVDLVVKQKREHARLYRQQGAHTLADQLLKEIGELK